MTTTSRIHRRSSNLPCRTLNKMLYIGSLWDSSIKFPWGISILLYYKNQCITHAPNCVHPSVFFKLFKMFHLQTPLHLNCGLNSEVSLAKLSNLLLMEHQPFNKSISLIYGPIWYRQNELLLVACSLQFDQQQSQTSINTIQIWQSYHIQKD